MNSSWGTLKLKSKYHFDTMKMDAKYDTIIKLGKVIADYSSEVETAIACAKSSTPFVISNNLQNISNLFGLSNSTNQVHVQLPGEVSILHLENLSDYHVEQPHAVKRIIIQLTDWQMGHFWSYGNYTHQGWVAGDVSTFDWHNVPHSTANAGHTPRVTLQMTGIVTEQTTEFLARLKRFDTYTLELKESSW
jgi:hypothetical protein